ncbi:MAG: hypothetical protein QOF51_3346 [Chloroflexota bacterium]|jgi:hypothetical protein|nr:hypothetical protein [Chloroflexota bacterium]
MRQLAGIQLPDMTGAMSVVPVGPAWRRVLLGALKGFGMSLMVQMMHPLGPVIPLIGPFVTGYVAAGRARATPFEGFCIGMGIGGCYVLLGCVLLAGGLAVCARLEPSPTVNVLLLVLIASVPIGYGTLLGSIGGTLAGRAEQRNGAK